VCVCVHGCVRGSTCEGTACNRLWAYVRLRCVLACIPGGQTTSTAHRCGSARPLVPPPTRRARGCSCPTAGSRQAAPQSRWAARTAPAVAVAVAAPAPAALAAPAARLVGLRVCAAARACVRGSAGCRAWAAGSGAGGCVVGGCVGGGGGGGRVCARAGHGRGGVQALEGPLARAACSHALLLLLLLLPTLLRVWPLIAPAPIPHSHALSLRKQEQQGIPSRQAGNVAHTAPNGN